MKTVWVKVDICKGCIDEDDAVGLWEVELNADLKPEFAAGAALDVFHSSVAIDELESYEIETLDPQTKEPICEADDYQQGSGPGGTVDRINDDFDELPSP